MRDFKKASLSAVLRSTLAVPFVALAVGAYDYLVYWLSNSVYQPSVLAASTIVGELGLIATLAIILVVYWSWLHELVNPKLDTKDTFLARFGRLFLPKAIVLLVLILVYRTEFVSHKFTILLFWMMTIGTILLDTIAARYKSLRLQAILRVEAHWFFPFVITCLVLVNSWDNVFFRFVGLHIAGFHRIVSILIVCAVSWMLFRYLVAEKRRLKNSSQWAGFSAIGLVVAMWGMSLVVTSPLVRASIVLNLRCGEALGVLFSPAVLGSTYTLRRLPGDGKTLATGVDPTELSFAAHDSRPLEKPANVWVVLVDTMRGDFMNCSESSVFPQKYRERFTCFSDTISSANSSHFAIPSLLDGRYRRPDSVFTFVAKAIPDNGFQVKGAAALNNIEEYIGFDARKELKPFYPPQWHHVNGLAKRYFSDLDRSKPFFFFNHYWDVHLPGWWPPSFFDVGYEWAVDYYGDCAGKATDALEDLFGFFEKEDLWKDTVVVVVGDHGDDLYEKGYYAHGYTMSQVVLSVPLFIYVPGLRGGTVGGPALTLDIMPTIADLFEIEGQSFDGISLLPAMSGKPISSRWRFSMSVSSEKFALERNGFKYVWDRERSTEELYNIKLDREERHNLIGDEPELASEMAQVLTVYIRNKANYLRRDVLNAAMKK